MGIVMCAYAVRKDRELNPNSDIGLKDLENQNTSLDNVLRGINITRKQISFMTLPTVIAEFYFGVRDNEATTLTRMPSKRKLCPEEMKGDENYACHEAFLITGEEARVREVYQTLHHFFEKGRGYNETNRIVERSPNA